MDRLNDLTRDEIDEIRARLDLKPRPCPYCQREFVPYRAGQVFCTSAHQKAWHKEAPQRHAREVEYLRGVLAQERAAWAKERDEFVREIQRLKGRAEGV